jgi:calcium/calmodulin-dependent protein kinase I
MPIVDAIKYCHSLGIVHRDIKPENLLYTTKDPATAIIKVSDFGLARTIQEEEFAQTTCGTPGYVAPEILEQLPYNKSCDLWSIGVVLYILLSGTPPFFDEDNFVLFEKIKNVDFNFDAPVWQSVSNEAKDIIRKLLVKNPDERLNPDEVLTHPWIVGTSKTTDIGAMKEMRAWN